MSNHIENLSWTLIETSDNGVSVFFRFLTKIPQNIKTQDYQYMVSIFWSYPIENKSGLPLEAIQEAHSKIEKALNVLDDHRTSFYVAQISGNGRKEWIWYTKDINIWWNGFIKALKNHPKYPLDIQKSEEPEWETYQIISKQKK